jgi:hypothetical protein
MVAPVVKQVNVTDAELLKFPPLGEIVGVETVGDGAVVNV